MEGGKKGGEERSRERYEQKQLNINQEGVAFQVLSIQLAHGCYEVSMLLAHG